MKLIDFIRDDIEVILHEWEKFAATINSDMTTVQLRDHAKSILKEIATDMAQDQSNHEKMEKSKGLAGGNLQDTAAEIHGKERLDLGFSINDTMSEFRALRANVMNLWWKSTGVLPPPVHEEISRFHEAIDQAITESLTGYSNEKELTTRLLETIMLASPDPIYVMDLDGSIILNNQASGNILGTGKGTVGHSIFESSSSLSNDLQKYFKKACATGKTVRGELDVSINQNSQTYECLHIPVLADDNDVEAVVSIWHNITERKIAEQKTWHNANHDPLTDLPNRRLFLDRLEQEIKNAARSTLPLAVLFIDLDGFKDVNDTLGHEVGDSLLCRVADRLNFCVRKNDIVARLGGDEFTVVITNLHEGMDVSVYALKIVEMIAEPFHLNGHNVMISCSIGIALYYQDTDSTEALLRRADQAMYAAKEGGRNQICFIGPTNVVNVGRFGGTDVPI